MAADWGGGVGVLGGNEDWELANDDDMRIR